jgi:hypothetical protein
MKTLARILFVACIAATLYFVTIGRDNFFWLIDSIYDVIQVIAANYTRK